MTAANIREKYKKLNIEIPKNATEFHIAAIDAVLSPLEQRSISGIIGTLPVIKDEKKATDAIIKLFEEQYAKIHEKVTAYKTQAENTTGLSDTDRARIEELTNTILTLDKLKTPTKATQEETQKLE